MTKAGRDDNIDPRSELLGNDNLTLPQDDEIDTQKGSQWPSGLSNYPSYSSHPDDIAVTQSNKNARPISTPPVNFARDSSLTGSSEEYPILPGNYARYSTSAGDYVNFSSSLGGKAKLTSQTENFVESVLPYNFALQSAYLRDTTDTPKSSQYCTEGFSQSLKSFTDLDYQ